MPVLFSRVKGGRVVVSRGLWGGFKEGGRCGCACWIVLVSRWNRSTESDFGAAVSLEGGGGAAVSRAALRGLTQDRKYVANFDGHFLSLSLPAEGRVVEFGYWPGGAAICQLQFPVERLRQVLER